MQIPAYTALERAVWRLRELRFDLREAHKAGHTASVQRLRAEVCEQEQRVREAEAALRAAAQIEE